MPGAIITLLAYLSYGAILTLVSDWAVHLGVGNKGLFFMVFTLASLLIRFLSGRISDRIERVIIIKLSLILLVIAMTLIGYASSPFSLMLSAGIYGMATGMLSPALTAWIIDLSDPKHRGKAVGTMYIALEAGIGLGAYLSGLLFVSDFAMIPLTFYLMAFAALAGFLYLQFLYKSIQSSHAN